MPRANLHPAVLVLAAACGGENRGSPDSDARVVATQVHPSTGAPPSTKALDACRQSFAWKPEAASTTSAEPPSRWDGSAEAWLDLARDPHDEEDLVPVAEALRDAKMAASPSAVTGALREAWLISVANGCQLFRVRWFPPDGSALDGAQAWRMLPTDCPEGAWFEVGTRPEPYYNLTYNTPLVMEAMRSTGRFCVRRAGEPIPAAFVLSAFVGGRAVDILDPRTGEDLLGDPPPGG
jgi:hypothetical protein